MKSDVDKGVDLIIIDKSSPLYIQLKSVSAKRWNTDFSISENLYCQKNWCVIVIKIEEQHSQLKYKYRLLKNNDVNILKLEAVKGKILDYRKVQIYQSHEVSLGDLLEFLTPEK
ncbi:hypothetical protein [Neolewinella litorea]|uniref:Uncharacterized protein n=1 Tax=Neolewinella litorea TaxID=2562452 RepID=A0A4S4NCD1_9BACT|nr:hypothetical protein [Neolewinella litorea]THH36385.1 hypothetical protein E4021_14970 [Neolewinella litorea]